MEFNSTGGMRSPFSPRVRQSITGRRPIGLASAKKNQSKFTQPTEQPAGDIIYKTPTLTLETYGMPLPVMVTETLTYASGDVSVCMSPCGWCWVVAGRKVLVWPREAASSTPAAPSAARELTLPQTDLAHKADLVMVFYEEGAQMPSCIGVSPEGVVRYWPSVGTEGAYSDVSCELAGQECDRLTEAKDGLLLATTTCTLVKLTTSKEGRPTVICQTLRPPSGWLGGIGRRVSLLFFGSMPAHVDTKLVGVVVLPSAPNPENPEEEEECIALVAGGPLLQLWCGAEVYEHHLRRPLTEAFARAHLAPQGELSGLELAALDVHAAGARALLVLLAAANVARSPDVRYAIAHISISRTEARVGSLCALRVPRDDAAPRCLPLGARPLLYAPAYVCAPAPAPASAPAAADACECADVGAADDRVLGAALCAGTPLVFTRKHGVLRLRYATDDAEHHAPSICDSPMGSPCPSDMYDGNLSLYEIDPHEVSASSTEAVGKLQAAFLLHVRGAGAAAARALAAGAGAGLARTVRVVAARMLDDAPAGDPRWRLRDPGPGVALGSSAALQASAQLRDKQRAFALFLEFLRAHGLWQRLASMDAEAGDVGDTGDAGDGEPVSTQWALCALAERLAAMRALQRLHQAGAPLVDAAFHQVATNADGEGDDEDEDVVAAFRGGALSAADVCLRRVTRAPRLLRALAALPAAAPAAALHACTALTTVLQEMHKCRAQWAQWAGAARPPPALGPRATLTALAHAHTRILQCARRCTEPSLRAQLLEAAAALADLLLADALPPHHHPHHHPHADHLYERMRADIIRPYFEEGQIERAAVLAEKFKDFDLLIEMCVERNDMERLYGYIDKYADEGVTEKAFAWMSSRGHSALLLRTLAAREEARARAWLAAAPARLPLRALHALGAGAGDLYAEMALEADTVARVTTLASIAKLCLAAGAGAGAGGAAWRRAEARLWLAEQQQALPRDIKLQHGLDCADAKLAEAEDLVQMYIDSDSRCLTEYDYKKALDLTDLVQDMERRDELRLRVWCASIRRDAWSQARVDAPADALRDFIFFRLIDLVHIMGGDIELLLPPLDDILTARELADLVSDARFRYLLQYGYQCVVAPHDDNDDP